MAIAFDTSNQANTASAVTTFSNSFTIGSSLSNGVMVAALCTFIAAGGATSSPSMTWNSVAMSAIASTTVNDSAGGLTTTLFGLVNPAGGSHTLAASWTTSATALIGFFTFSGVDQTGGTTTFLNGTSLDQSTANTTATLSVTTVNGNATVCVWNVGNTISASGQTPVADWKTSVIAGQDAEGQHILSTSTSDSYTATLSTADVITGTGCCLKAAAASLITLPRRRLVYRRMT